MLLLCGSVLLGARLLATADDTVGVWATATTLVEGQQVSTDDLVPVQVRFAEAEAVDRYVAAGDELPAGVVMAHDVGPGELLPRAALVPGSEEELVEVPLAVEAAGIPSSVQVGSRVDVWVTPATGRAEDAGAPAEAVRVLADVAVVADGGLDATTGGFGGELQPVVVGVPRAVQGELPRVLARLADGEVVLVRRQG